MIKLSSFVFVLAFLQACVGHRIAKAGIEAISDFQVQSATLDTITLSWTNISPDYSVLKYTITRDDFWNYDDQCSSSSCTYTVTQLNACNSYNFKIVALLDVDGEYTPSDPATTTGSTQGSTPGTIGNVVHDNGVISWSKEHCSTDYEVCFHIRGSTDGETCDVTTETTYNLGELQMCALYDVTVHGRTGEGVVGEDTTISFETEKGLPGQVTNVEVMYIGKTVITVGFDDPQENPLCADGFGLAIIETRGINTYTIPNLKSEHTHQLNATGLHPCSDITLGVYATTDDFQKSEYVVLNTSTAESAPSPPIDLEVTEADGTYHVTWVNDPNDNCAGQYEFCFISEVGEEDCQTSSEDNYIDYGPVIACIKYEMVVIPTSPTGIPGDTVVYNIDAIDARPGKVTNYTVETLSDTEIVVSFNDPTENTECVAGYDQVSKNLNEASRKTSFFVDNEDILNNLEPCCTYEVTTTPISLTGMRGTPAKDQTTLLERVPAPPQKLEMLPDQSSETALYMKWWRPSHSEFCVSSYNIVYTTGGESKEVDLMTDGSIFEVRYLLEGLTPCTQYDIEIKAVTPSGAKTDAATAQGTTLGC